MQKAIAKGRILVRPEMYSQSQELSSAGFEDLALPLFRPLYNYAHWLTHNREDAEDLVQETYAKALKGFSSFQKGTNFRAWMYRILRNNFLSSRTALQVAMTLPLGAEEDGNHAPVELHTPETIALELSSRAQIQAAIEELPTYFQEALLLCDVEEMSYREIAETLSIPIGTVMSRVARARKALRLVLANVSVATSSAGHFKEDSEPERC